ncbi:MAG: hypothetical protein EHM83_05055 [Burkholderiales bacterium]|nr:MAG: hypothetical protein EHM83_05055 [Burkholderiales bacterium]
MSLSEFAYAQARLQARHGRGPGASVWQALEGSHTAAHYLALARAGPLAPWVEGLDEAGDVHRVERHLQLRWRRLVSEVADWLPPRWQPAATWFGTLTALPLGDDARSGGRVAANWLEQWHRLLPADAGDRALLRQPAELLLPRLAGASGGRRAAVESERRALLKLFRRRAGTAVAVFAYLALVALDVERLRGGLVVRTLFEPAPEPQES